jgi:hypothetical protein
MKQFEFLHKGQVTVPSLFAENRIEAKTELRKLGFKDDPHFVEGVIREKQDEHQPRFLHMNRPFGLDFLL